MYPHMFLAEITTTMMIAAGAAAFSLVFFILASIGLIISTFWRRKPKGNPQSDDRKKAG